MIDADDERFVGGFLFGTKRGKREEEVRGGEDAEEEEEEDICMCDFEWLL